MNLIAAVDANWAIGYKNKLLVSIPDDMKFFRQTTTGKVVVMGRKTLESFQMDSLLRTVSILY
nr:dihydrofolate reductase [Roseburia sp. AF42-8]